MDIFTRFAPFIQDYIYEHGWKNLRSIQVGAAETIFNSPSFRSLYSISSRRHAMFAFC